MMPSIVNNPAFLILECSDLLHRLGASFRYRGMKYTVLATALVVEDPERLTYLTKGVYMELAQRTGENAANIERNIRSIVTVIWKNPNHILLDDLAGRHLVRKPTNGEFLAILANYFIAR